MFLSAGFTEEAEEAEADGTRVNSNKMTTLSIETRSVVCPAAFSLVSDLKLLGLPVPH